MKVIKKFTTKYFQHFNYFYSYLGYRIFIAFLLSIGVAFLDGLGLAMFLPLLETINGESEKASSLGNLNFLIDGIRYLGFNITVTVILFIMVIFFFLKGIVKFFEGYYKVYIQRYFVKKLRFEQIKSLEEFQYKSFVLADSGRIQNTLSGEVARVFSSFNSFFNMMQGFMMVMVYVGLAFTVNFQFTLLVMCLGLLSNFVYANIFKRTKAISRQITDQANTFQGYIIQFVAFFKYLKATGRLEDFGNKLRKKVLDIEGSLRSIGVLNAVINSIREPLIIVAVVAVIIIEYRFLEGDMSLIILSLLFFYRALTYLMHLQNYWNSFLVNHGALEHMKEFFSELDESKEIQGIEVFEGFTSLLSIENVGFNYNRTRVLENISFEIQKNQTIAIVGESGSGKTTLMNLLTGLFLPDSGNILIDGNSIYDFDRISYQRKIGYITQEPVIFDDSIFNNVTFWDEQNDVNINKFNEALRKASILDFVNGLEQKGNSRLGNNGIMVSGGQKQRLAIARELYKEVDFLFMDEATSSLDSETEKFIQENIELLKGKLTIIIIAHRLSTVKNVDKIILLESGRSIQAGSFEELINISEPFKKMVDLQDF